MSTEQDRPVIRVFWWQGGVHIEPQTDEHRAMLVSLCEALQSVRVDHSVHAGPVRAVHAHDQQSIIGVHKGPKVIP